MKIPLMMCPKRDTSRTNEAASHRPYKLRQSNEICLVFYRMVFNYDMKTCPKCLTFNFQAKIKTKTIFFSSKTNFNKKK